MSLHPRPQVPGVAPGERIWEATMNDDASIHCCTERRHRQHGKDQHFYRILLKFRQDVSTYFPRVVSVGSRVLDLCRVNASVWAMSSETGMTSIVQRSKAVRSETGVASIEQQRSQVTFSLQDYQLLEIMNGREGCA